jgi:pyridoxamine--pyruvate transaminase
MGLELWAAREEIASPTATAVRVPEGIRDEDWRLVARDEFGVMLSSGRGETLGRLVRIGHMGPTARPMYAVVAITALGGAARKMGVTVDVGAGVEAALAVIAAAN